MADAQEVLQEQMKKVHQKQEAKKMPDEGVAVPSGNLTTAAEMIAGYQTKDIVLPATGWEISIKSLSPGDHVAVFGSPIGALMTSVGLDADKKEEREEFINNASQQQMDILLADQAREAKRVTVAAVTSVNLSLLPQHLCKPDEVSIERFAERDILFIYDEVGKISGWEADRERFQKRLRLGDEGRDSE